ncbi:IS1595 family transposase [Dysgonomonas sp. 520]|uniref:IS1595 family transposase n=1 Tax=Dysgonomonas sp. 520 TaxID=2302931 RepID=UPI0013D2076B|nr:IS1595 family transposase [Dysgonomonas sp. 520]NDW11215.1 IS1595 family transposase [Dysgonomonas sp. 520]
MKGIKSFIHLIKSLHDRKSCMEFLEEHRWQGVPKCHHCNCQSENHYKLKPTGEFNGLYKCRYCRKTFNVIKGTMFEGSKVPLEKWFYAIYIFLSHKKGISSLQLARDIEVTQATAWYMLQKIRSNLSIPTHDILDSFDGIVQVDETYIGGKDKGRIWQNKGRSTKQKTAVVGVISDNKVCALVVKNTDGNTLKGIVYGLIKPGSTVVTDGWKGYLGISNMYDHQIVKHSKGSYKNKEGYHTNGIEGFWSHLKRGLKCTYHSASRKHLQKYCDEFAYTYNTRKISDVERFILFITSMHKRFSYSELTSELGRF